MVKVKYNKLFFFYAIIALYSIAFLINFVGENFRQLHFGKDGGLLFRIIATGLTGSLFFYFLKNKKIGWLLLGLLTGICSYLLTFLIYILTSIVFKGNNSGWDIPYIFDQLIATTMIFFAGIFSIRIKNRLFKPS